MVVVGCVLFGMMVTSMCWGMGGGFESVRVGMGWTCRGFIWPKIGILLTGHFSLAHLMA